MKATDRFYSVRLAAAAAAVMILLGLNMPSLALKRQITPFTPITGPTLRDRFESAITQGKRDNSGKRFWIGYSFPPRPGVYIDGNVISGQTYVMDNNGSWRPAEETRNLGIFFGYGADGIERCKILNLDRDHDFRSELVLWLGKVETAESVPFLKRIVDSKPSPEISRTCVDALGAHEGDEPAPVLEELSGRAYPEPVRSAAVLFVGRFPGHCQFLSRMVLDGQESLELRKKAIFSIGSSEDESSFPTLKSLYESVGPIELRKQIVFAVSISKDKDATAFLITLAKNEPDTEVRKSAIFWMAQKAGQRTLQVLGDIVTGKDENTEVQKAALFAISQRPKDEAIPFLIKVARTHPSAQVRKQAIFWLGQTGDPRAADFLEEILTK
jgi:HEAT repeat protein